MTMPNMPDFDVAIAGAGIVGVSTALWAQMRGHQVLLVDPAEPGSGTSSGNACTLATYACLPVNDPSVLWSLPELLTSRNSPLAISLPYALRRPGWMLSFLANCRASRSTAIAGHLADLLSRADAGLNPLIEAAGAQDLIVARGQLSIWSTQAGAKAAERGLARRRALGVSFDTLSPQEAHDMEPGLDLPIARAVFYPEARHVTDPQELTRRLVARFVALGGTVQQARVERMDPLPEGVALQIAGNRITARRAVVAAGAFSHRIPGSGADQVPLGVERGYHLLYSGQAHRLTRPVGWAEGGFYATPMAHGLRLAGTVELAALDAPKNTERLRYIERRAGEVFADLPAPSQTWLGFRPTLPDSMPVIGPCPKAPAILHAFGHQHLGLTLAGITGRMVTDLIEQRQPNLNLRPFSADRRFI